MATTPDIDETKIASHTLAYLRSLDRKFDLVVDVLQGHGERLGRLDRDQGETRRNLGEIRRNITEVKGDTALLDNKEMFDRGRGRHRHPDRHQERQAPRHRWNCQ